jgi:excisionase family DNA binding protein
MSIAESELALQEKEFFGELIDRPELVDSISRSKLPAVMNHAAALQAKAAALQSRIASRLLNEPEQLLSQQDVRLIRADEASNRLGYRIQCLYKLIRERRFPAHREGRKIRICVGELNAWIRDHSQKPVDVGQHSTHISIDERKRARIEQVFLGSYPGRVSGPRRRPEKSCHSLGTSQDGHPRATGSSDSIGTRVNES